MEYEEVKKVIDSYSRKLQRTIPDWQDRPLRSYINDIQLFTYFSEEELDKIMREAK